MKHNTHQNNQQPQGFLRLPEVLKLFPVSRSTFLAGVAAGKYPKPIRLTERCVAWRVEDIYALLERSSNAAS